MRRLLRTTAAVTFLLAAPLGLAGCGGSSSSSSGTLPTKVVHITFHGSDVTPNGSKIDVAVGQRLQFDVTADAPGEIHVHSSPAEQEFEYQSGSSTFAVKPVPAPGQVVVESHTLGKVLFVLVAR